MIDHDDTVAVAVEGQAELGAAFDHAALITAVKEGARLRLRPKVMTVATTLAICSGVHSVSPCPIETLAVWAELQRARGSFWRMYFGPGTRPLTSPVRWMSDFRPSPKMSEIFWMFSIPAALPYW